MLGPVEVWDDGRQIALPGPKPRALLALLLLHVDEVVSAGALIEALWGERPPDTAAKVVQTYISQLRKLVGAERIETRGAGYVIRATPDELDSLRSEQLVAAGRAALRNGRPEEASERLGDALRLWRGPLPDDVAGLVEGRRLEEERVLALEDRLEADLRSGLGAELVPELEALVAREPLRERPRGQLMLALYRAGRQADALEAYRRARKMLVDELGLEPSPDLQQLEKRILVQDPSLASPARPPAATRSPRRRLVLAALALAVAAGTAIGIYAAAGGSTSGTAVPPNSVAAIDPRTNRIAGTLAVGVDPRSLAYGAGSVWVANVGDETVSRIDPSTLTLERTISIGDYPSDVAVGLGATWVASGPLGRLIRIDSATDAPGAPRAAPACGPHASLTIGAGSLWIVCDVSPDAVRIAPSGAQDEFGVRTGLLTSANGSVVPHFSDVGFGEGAIWIVDRGQNVVDELDTSTLQLVRRIDVGRDPVAVAVGAGAVWVAEEDDNAVTRIDVTSNGSAAVRAVPVGRRPVDVAVEGDAVWVADAGDRAVVRIDPRTGRVLATVHLGDVPRRLAAGGGRVWVTVGPA